MPVFTFPSVVVVAVLMAFPVLYTLYMSVHSWFASSLTSPEFVGLANFRRAFLDDERFRNALWLTVYFTALGLGLDEHFFDDKIDRHITAMRLNFYPEVKEPPKAGQLRGGEHTDYGLLTILNGENVPGGLQVYSERLLLVAGGDAGGTPGPGTFGVVERISM